MQSEPLLSWCLDASLRSDAESATLCVGEWLMELLTKLMNLLSLDKVLCLYLSSWFEIFLVLDHNFLCTSI